MGLVLLPHIDSSDGHSDTETRSWGRYHAQPPGLIVSEGQRLSAPSAAGLIEVALDPSGAVGRLSVPQAPDRNALLPLRFAALNPRWTVGFAQHAG